MKLLSLIMLVSLASLSCSPKVQKLVAQPVVVKEKIVTNTDVQVYDPKVDILFVVDNSGSMDGHQRNLIANLDKFVKAFTQNIQIDYHIGVLTSDNDGLYGNSRDCCGKLVGTIPFVERGTLNGSNTLARNLRVGIDGSGTEQSFSPVVDALSQPLVDTYNKGFYRKDAHLAIIFLTDAEDQSKISSRDFYQFLLNLKGAKEKVLAYGAIVPTYADEDTCRRDERGRSPDKIEDFLSIVFNAGAGKNILSLCDPLFGDQLAKMSQDLVSKVGGVIYLNRPPILASIRVMYGTQEILRDYKKGWSFSPELNAIVLGQDIEWSQQPAGTKVRVFFEATQY